MMLIVPLPQSGRCTFEVAEIGPGQERLHAL